jgi:hypothetical protein
MPFDALPAFIEIGKLLTEAVEMLVRKLCSAHVSDTGDR